MRIFIIRAKTLVFAVLTAALILPLIYFIPSAVETFSPAGRELPVYSVERGDDKIALTFDCAWSADDIDAIIAALKQSGCTAAFFVTGEWADRNPGAVKKIHDAGHIIGNHSYNHADYTKMSAAEICADLDKADEAIKKACGAKPEFMRAPSGAYNDTVVRAAHNSGRIYLQWSVDTLDYRAGASRESIMNKISLVKSGDIILMHSGTELTARLLPEILAVLKKSFTLSSVDELVYKSDFTIDHTGRQYRK